VPLSHQWRASASRLAHGASQHDESEDGRQAVVVCGGWWREDGGMMANYVYGMAVAHMVADSMYM